MPTNYDAIEEAAKRYAAWDCDQDQDQEAREELWSHELDNQARGMYRAAVAPGVFAAEVIQEQVIQRAAADLEAAKAAEVYGRVMGSRSSTYMVIGPDGTETARGERA